VGSAGIVKRTFVSVSDGSAFELGSDGDLGLFALGGVKVRQVTSRNAPSVINAVFNLRNFWDGRANDIFNAVTPFGGADARATVLAVSGTTLASEVVRLDRSSLASQAVGPPLNGMEMSYDGRAWMDLGRKLLAVAPLARQIVAADDSVLGSWANQGTTGLQAGVTYDALIRAAFNPCDPQIFRPTATCGRRFQISRQTHSRSSRGRARGLAPSPTRLHDSGRFGRTQENLRGDRNVA
jgi:di-heme cytochrome c peroxidase